MTTTIKILSREIHKFNYESNETLNDLVFDLTNRIKDNPTILTSNSSYKPKIKVFDVDEYPEDFKHFLNECITLSLHRENVRYNNHKIILNWVNIHDRVLNVHREHTHQNSIFSGVYYHETIKNDSLTFYQTEPVMGTIYDITKKDSSSFFMKKEKVFVNSGDLLIFRSYYEHGVERFQISPEENRRRISFSFNIDLEGIGSLDRLTYR